MYVNIHIIQIVNSRKFQSKKSLQPKKVDDLTLYKKGIGELVN
jgi:hypothetical protein